MNARGQAARIGLGLLLLLAIVAYTVNIKTAVWFVSCLVVGYLNAFYAFRSILALVRRKVVGARSWVVSALALGASVVIVCVGYGPVLVITTLGSIWIDALLLRFR